MRCVTRTSPVVNPLRRLAAIALAAAVVNGAAFPSAAQSPSNGFDLSNATVPVDEIRRGGPPRDGIPSIDEPKFTSVGKVDFLKDSDLVFGFENDGDRRAYPLRVLVWHEIVNDVVGKIPVAITYCPLCGTAMVFDRRHGDKTLSFGVSGLLFQSDVLMYDRETESLWSQLGMKSLAGPMVDSELKWLDGELMTWSAWQEKFPKSQVLTTETGYLRRYSVEAYRGYEDTPDLMFPVPQTRTELDNKTWVAGLLVDGMAAAFSIPALAEAPGNSAEIELSGTKVTARYSPDTREIIATDAKGNRLPVVQVYWFAWQAFYPETSLWRNQ